MIEVSHVDGQWWYAEVEFETEQKANEFIIPAELANVIVKEITNDAEYKMKNYWKRTRLKERDFINIPFWEQYTLSVEEPAAYFRLGEGKLRRLISENKDADYVLWNNSRALIKRKKFEDYIDRANII